MGQAERGTCFCLSFSLHETSEAPTRQPPTNPRCHPEDPKRSKGQKDLRLPFCTFPARNEIAHPSHTTLSCHPDAALPSRPRHDRSGSADQHRDLLAQTGFSSIRVDTKPAKGWNCSPRRSSLTRPAEKGWVHSKVRQQIFSMQHFRMPWRPCYCGQRSPRRLDPHFLPRASTHE